MPIGCYSDWGKSVLRLKISLQVSSCEVFLEMQCVEYSIDLLLQPFKRTEKSDSVISRAGTMSTLRAYVQCMQSLADQKMQTNNFERKRFELWQIYVFHRSKSRKNILVTFKSWVWLKDIDLLVTKFTLTVKNSVWNELHAMWPAIKRVFWLLAQEVPVLMTITWHQTWALWLI